MPSNLSVYSVMKVFRTLVLAGSIAIGMLSQETAEHANAKNANIDQTEYVSPEDLFNVLKSQDVDKIIRTTNKIKFMSYKGVMLPVIHELWIKQVHKYPDLPWDTINLPIIRLEFADILVQAQRKGLITVDSEDLHSFVASLIEKDDVMLSINAILVLSFFDEKRDVHKILAIAKNQRRATFRTAVVALGNMCVPDARVALDDLEKYVTDERRRRFIVQTRRRYEEFGICK